MAARISQSPYGTTPDGTAVELYTLTNAHGLVCKLITYGAAITELHVPDKHGKLVDVVLGFDNLTQYLNDSPCFGATVGRVANRIAHGQFTLDGQTYTLPVNDPPNTLHGGPKGFDKLIWSAAPVESPQGPAVAFTLVSPAGQEGFPGTLQVKVTYTLTEADEVQIEFAATTNQTTPVNLTNHSYFNLAGSGTAEGHLLQIFASRYTATDDTQIPTGVLAAVAGGPLDFTIAKTIGRDIHRVPDCKIGYDHNYVIDGGGKGMVLAARAQDPASGRTMDVVTDQPGIQFYSANKFYGTLVGKYGQAYPFHGALCLETQHFPDSVNHPGFPSTLLRPGETFRSTTIYRFTAR
jgi:aldose 1-epimerase